MKEIRIIFEGLAPTVFFDGVEVPSSVKASVKPLSQQPNTPILARDVRLSIATRIFTEEGLEEVKKSSAEFQGRIGSPAVSDSEDDDNDLDEGTKVN